MRSVREKINDTKESISPYMMMEGFAGSLEKYSNKTALITPNGEYTYSSLAKYVATVYDILKKEGVGKGDIVGVDISKGVWQIASVLGILFAEALYVPLDTNQPLKRKEKIVNSAGINLMLTEQENLVLSNNCKVLNVTEIKTLKDSFEIPAIEKDYDRPAYIIFTSGTTGEPKGVIITHRAAMNTICNINQKYNITERDVFFGLANLSFDLSVYDIFGCYQVGGTLVLPDSSSIKDPKQLTELLVVHGVTVWNSVPAQMQMVINYMENSKVNSNIELRVVLLSGDWIPVNLPKKIYEKFNKSRVVSLGGATEASIWSIYYDIQREDDFEKSIPYNIIERPNGELMEHQLKMLNILFRVFSQNFRCVSTYEPKPYYGNMRILCCEIQGGHFYPGFFAEDYETWKPYAKGNLTFDLIKGWHLDCITEPNLGENIKKMLDFNY